MHEFVTVSQAAALLGISEVAIREAIRQGDIIGGKVGGRYYALKDSVLAYQPRAYSRQYTQTYELIQGMRERLEEARQHLAERLCDIDVDAAYLLEQGGVTEDHDKGGGLTAFVMSPRHGTLEGIDYNGYYPDFPRCVFPLSDNEALNEEQIEERILDWAHKVVGKYKVVRLASESGL